MASLRDELLSNGEAKDLTKLSLRSKLTGKRKDKKKKKKKQKLEERNEDIQEV